tara:strand:- start:185 stop:394 length:210 start_codon:yes stop_codon:yes gene_type:complete
MTPGGGLTIKRLPLYVSSKTNLVINFMLRRKMKLEFDNSRIERENLKYTLRNLLDDTERRIQGNPTSIL